MKTYLQCRLFIITIMDNESGIDLNFDFSDLYDLYDFNDDKLSTALDKSHDAFYELKSKITVPDEM